MCQHRNTRHTRTNRFPKYHPIDLMEISPHGACSLKVALQAGKKFFQKIRRKDSIRPPYQRMRPKYIHMGSDTGALSVMLHITLHGTTEKKKVSQVPSSASVPWLSGTMTKIIASPSIPAMWSKKSDDIWQRGDSNN